METATTNVIFNESVRFKPPRPVLLNRQEAEMRAVKKLWVSAEPSVTL